MTDQLDEEPGGWRREREVMMCKHMPGQLDEVIPSTPPHLQLDEGIPSTPPHLQLGEGIPSTPPHLQLGEGIPSTPPYRQFLHGRQVVKE